MEGNAHAKYREIRNQFPLYVYSILYIPLVLHTTTDSQCAGSSTYQSLNLNLGFIHRRFFFQNTSLDHKKLTLKVTNVIALSCLALDEKRFFFIAHTLDNLILLQATSC